MGRINKYDVVDFLHIIVPKHMEEYNQANSTLQIDGEGDCVLAKILTRDEYEKSHAVCALELEIVEGGKTVLTLNESTSFDVTDAWRDYVTRKAEFNKSIVK